ncbi:hypothetical protein JHU04_003532 [Brenneria sp. 4F2]|nr:hypothetical protein [Brenneria bubanii]
MDTLDRLAGLDEQGELFAIRRRRPEYVNGIEQCRRSVLTPHHDLQLSSALRIALAARISRLTGVVSLLEHYRQWLDTLNPDPWLRDIAAGISPAVESKMIQEIVAHCDKVTSSPKRSRQEDIARLLAAGLTTPQIVALSELIAFVNFEARVTAGMTLLDTLP